MRGLGASLLLVALATNLGRANVVTSVSGTRLIVTGDDSADTVSIEPAVDGVAVVGLHGTLVDGSSAGVIVSGVQRLTVKLGKGADWLTLTQVNFSKGIHVRLGDGDDGVELDGVSGGASRIRTGNGYDAVQVFGSRFQQLSVETSTGYDLVLLDGVWVPGDLDVDTGSWADEVTIVATEVGDDVDVHLGNDDDLLVLADVAFDDDTHLDAESGYDLLVFSGYIWFGDELDIDGFGDDWWW